MKTDNHETTPENRAGKIPLKRLVNCLSSAPPYLIPTTVYGLDWSGEWKANAIAVPYHKKHKGKTKKWGLTPIFLLFFCLKWGLTPIFLFLCDPYFYAYFYDPYF